MSGAVTVTQADREAAVAYAAAVGWCVDLDWLRETDLPVPLTQAFARHRHAAEAASKQQVAELVEALVKMLPANLCLTNRTLPDDMNIPLEWDVTMGELREVAALLARAKAAAHA